MCEYRGDDMVVIYMSKLIFTTKGGYLEECIKDAKNAVGLWQRGKIFIFPFQIGKKVYRRSGKNLESRIIRELNETVIHELCHEIFDKERGVNVKDEGWIEHMEGRIKPFL